MRCLFIRAMCFLFAVSLTVPSMAATKRFPEKVNRFLNTYCVSCHGPKKSKGGIRLDKMSQDLAAGPDAEDWHEALDALNTSEMPPEDEKQPTAEERNEVASYLTAAFKDAARKRRSTGGKVVMRRLTNYEYNNTLNDLLSLNENFSKDFPPDSVSEEGFKNNGFYMHMSSLQMENYIAAARQALDLAVYKGERPELKTIDIKDATTLNYRHKGQKKALNLKQKNIGGMLHWENHPREGTVLLEVTLSGVKDASLLDGRLRLEAGVRLRKKGPPLYSFKDVRDKPTVTEKDGLVHLRYEIEKIENYPLPDKNHRFFDLVLNLSSPNAGGVRVVSMKAQGPYYETWPPKSHQRIFIPSRNTSNEAVYAREVIKDFMSRAWRRSVSGQEVDAIHKVYLRNRKASPFVDSIKDALARILVSPDFLYLVETKSKAGTREKISPHELATRLSYFLWSSIPDDKLRQLADSGKITNPDVLSAEIKRLLANERSWDFVEQFTTQWLELDKIDVVAVSPELYPAFHDELKRDMKDQTLHFVAHLLRENMSALNLIDSEFDMVNERLKFHFKRRKGSNLSVAFKKVPADHRRGGGILSHAGIQLANSDGEDSHVIARGVWLIDKILGDPPPPPPADVELDAEIIGFDKMSKKQQLLAHVEKESCANCHKKIDPFGVAFEQFDAVGAVRDKIRKVDQAELDRRLSEATKGDPKADFKRLDKDGNGSISEAEWFAYRDAKYPVNKNDPKAMRNRMRGFISVAQVGQDKEGITHPKRSISLREYLEHVEKVQRKKVAGIQSKIPYHYIGVDASTQLPDDTRITGLAGLQSYILKHKKSEFAENLVRRLLAYALGRSLEFSDQQAVDQLTRQFSQNDYKLAGLVEAIVLSDLFQTK